MCSTFKTLMTTSMFVYSCDILSMQEKTRCLRNYLSIVVRIRVTTELMIPLWDTNNLSFSGALALFRWQQNWSLEYSGVGEIRHPNDAPNEAECTQAWAEHIICCLLFFTLLTNVRYLGPKVLKGTEAWDGLFASWNKWRLVI